MAFFAEDLAVETASTQTKSAYARRRRKPRLEVFKLIDGVYDLLPGNPVWMPEIGLGIGRETGVYQGINREWLYWYDRQNQRFLTAEERAFAAERRAEQAERRAEILEERLRSLGVDPDTLT